MDKKKKKQYAENKFAPGLDDHDELSQDASSDEVNKGNYTKVTTLSYNEIDSS